MPNQQAALDMLLALNRPRRLSALANKRLFTALLSSQVEYDFRIIVSDRHAEFSAARADRRSCLDSARHQCLVLGAAAGVCDSRC